MFPVGHFERWKVLQLMLESPVAQAEQHFEQRRGLLLFRPGVRSR
jgi:hypothetical protein